MANNRKLRKKQNKTTNPRLRDGLDEAEALISRGRWEQAQTLLERLNQAFPDNSEVLHQLVDVGHHLDDTHILHYACANLLRLCPHDEWLPIMLTTTSFKSGYYALALVMARRTLAAQPVHPEAERVRAMLPGIEALVNEEITRLGLGGADGLECLTMHDELRSLLEQGRYTRAREIADQLIERRPGFTPAHNNAADACFADGRIGQAIDRVKRLLALDPDNVFALANLVRYLTASGKLEEAHRQAERLKAFEPQSKSLVFKQAEALAWLGDDSGVLAVFERGRQFGKSDDPEYEALLYHLAAVAAWRQGREQEARDFWRSALEAVPQFPLAQRNLADLELPVGQRNAPWSFRFSDFVPRNLAQRLVSRLAPAGKRGREEPSLPDKERFLHAYPEIEGLVPLLLDRGDLPGREFALLLARLFRTPAMLAAVVEFALGQRGSDQLRFDALTLAEQAGRIKTGPRRLWMDGEWRETDMFRVEVHGGPVDRPHAPGVLPLIKESGEAMLAGDAERGERLLRQALAIDPNDPQVLNNLAAACAELDRADESEALSIRLHEIDPDYLFGRTALANLATQRGQFERARELLKPLLMRRRLHVGEFVSLCTAQLSLYLAEGKRKEAEQWLHLWRNAIPGHPDLSSFEARVHQLH